ncbi:MAG TPA: hypothetical protein VMW06_03285 [Desulfobacterales bacterium]|nr:hypothetical protein [Desulfobacterales bacterium]
MASLIPDHPLYRPDPMYDQFLSDLESVPENKQREILREVVKNDLYFLAKYILGHWWICWEPHKAFCEEIEKDINLTLYLLPRGHCKTQIYNTSDTIRQYLKTPSEPIGIFCDQAKKAKWKLRPIRNQFQKNQTLKWLFPELFFQNPKRESDKWTDEELILKVHDGGQEPSIGAYGMDNMPTGLHFPRIKGDDLVTPETVTTADQINKTRHNYGTIRSSILYPNGNIQICGTIYDDGDLHREMEESGEYQVYKRPAEWLEDIDRGVKQRRTLWPVQFGPAALDKIKRDPTVGLYIYSCQYLLDPVPEDENAFFQLKWFGRYTKLPRRLNMFAAADLAISEKKTAAETAIVVGGVNTYFDLFIIDIIHGHWDALAIIDEMIEVQRKYKPGIFTIEAENIQRTIMPFLKIKMRETGYFINTDPRMPKGDKVAKARPAQGRAKEGAVFLPKKAPDQPEWLSHAELQIRRFPKGKDKDIIDSIALLCHQLAEHWRPATPGEIEERQKDKYVPLDATVGM